MVTSQLRGLIRHLEKLSAAHCPERPTDRQLLDAFAASRDEAAFGELVARHGPLVLRVCRRVLRQQQDAEDAFQATFLVLARSASSIRQREAVAGWLHGVAYRTAMKARRGAARRRNHEVQSVGRTPPSASPTWDDVQAVLDEEIQRLPEVFRTAFVLCVLEGKTVVVVAAESGCKENTVAGRVKRARQRLRSQLEGRGIKLGALLAALSLAESGRAAVPASLAETAIRFGLLVAAGGSAAGVIPARVAALATGVTRAMLLNKATIATAVLLTVGLLAGAASLTCRALAARETEKPPATEKAPDQKTEPGARKDDAKKQAADDKETIAYAGRVLGPVGRPVARAKLLHKNYGTPATEQATTGRDGRFAFSVPKVKSFDNEWAAIAVTAPGHGVVWVALWPNDKRDGLTLRLVKDDVPITGRIVDLEGKPVAGATVTVLSVSAAPGEDLGNWLEAAAAKKVKKDQSLRSFELPRAPRMTTDAEGRFRISGAGIGRDRLVRARLDGSTIASQYVTILTRPGKPIDVKEYQGQPGVTTCYGADFRHAAAPTKPVVGVVRDRDTNKPLAGVTVESNRLANGEMPDRNIVRTTTDAKGRYRLTGMPKGKGNIIRLVPGDDQPYPSVHAEVPDTPGLDPVTVDFELKRGIWVEGKLTDKVTGKSVKAYVDYFALHDNPNLRDHPGFDGTVPPLWGVATKADGSYRVVGLPGPGLIVVYQTGDHLRAPERDDEFKLKDESPLLTSPFQLALAVNYTAVARIDPAKGVDSVKRDVTLDPGWTFSGKVVGPDDKPLSGALGFGLNNRNPAWNAGGIKAAEFVVRKFNPRGSRDVLFQHREKGLIGIARPPKENGGSVTVRMEPGAAVTGRLVDADGKPRAGVELEVAFHPKGKWGWWEDYSPARVRTDGRAGSASTC
jgi:RNA polymerase sigma factor (sigma-70 family)